MVFLITDKRLSLSMGVSVPKMSTYKPADLIMIDGSLYKCIESNVPFSCKIHSIVLLLAAVFLKKTNIVLTNS